MHAVASADAKQARLVTQDLCNSALACHGKLSRIPDLCEELCAPGDYRCRPVVAAFCDAADEELHAVHSAARNG